jgi:beta-glucosidase-like glycosyl hydrolase
MIPFNYMDFIGNLTSLVNDNTIPISRIDDAVSRILRVKFTMGLFENPFPDPSLAGELGKQVSLTMHSAPFTVSICKIISSLFAGNTIR